MGPGFESPKVHQACESKSRSRSRKSVLWSQRVHLFPFRTQKLSSAEAKILAWRRAGKIVQCWHKPPERSGGEESGRNRTKLVFLPQRVHLFPFRTQKLSSVGVKILAWRRAGKITQRQHHGRNTVRHQVQLILSVSCFLIFLLSSVGSGFVTYRTLRAMEEFTKNRPQYLFNTDIFLLSSVGRAPDC